MSLYEDLGVSPDATPEEIKAAGKRRAKEHHPDRGGDAEAFDRARKALAVLSDPARRERYDRTGEAEHSADPAALEEIEAAQMVMQGMVSVLQDVGLHPEHTDVVVRVRQHIDAQIRQLRQSRTEFEVARLRNEKFLKRLKVKKGAPDPIGQFLRDQLKHIATALLDNDRRQRIAERAKVLAGAYSYTTDGPDMERAYREAFAGLGSTASGSTFFDMMGRR